MREEPSLFEFFRAETSSNKVQDDREVINKNSNKKQKHIMKKTYLQPTVDVIEIQTMSMLASSLLIDNSTDNMIEDPSVILSREMNLPFNIFE